jgi:predicted nuclease of predicted toxin-antitoxin system
MKKYILIGLVTVLAGSVLAGSITQTADAIPKNLPRIQFYDKINDALYDLTVTDIPALIAANNALSAGITATAEEINAVADPAVAAPANATNTQVVTLDFTKSVMQLAAQNETTTITLANVATADIGKSIILVNVGGTNALAIAKTGNYYGTAAALDDDQSIVIYSTATNVLLSYGGQ